MNGKLVLAAALAVALGPAPQARPPRAPDLQNPYRASRKGNIVGALEWMNDEPALFLMAYPPASGKGYCLPLSRISRYVTTGGQALPALSEVARLAALRLGLDTTVHTINLICDVVMFNVPDLMAMPASPPATH